MQLLRHHGGRAKTMPRISTCLAGFLVLAVFAIAGCEGEQGPMGPEGPQGLPGPVGADLNANCTQCHVNDVKLISKMQQFAMSRHGPGWYTRDTGLCVNCHSHQGYLARIETGVWAEPTDPIDNVASLNCRTCHQIHTTYTDADFAFTRSAATDFAVAGVTVDLGIAGNLCSGCHQARPSGYEMPVIDGSPVTLTSSSFGPHYGGQSEMYAGIGLFDFNSGSGLGGMHYHATDPLSRGCPTCHMAPGVYNGGHTWAMRDVREERTSANYTGCEDCHAGLDTFDRNGVQTLVQALEDSLGTIMVTLGAMTWDASRERYRAVTTDPVPANIAAAIWNLQAVHYDKSKGIHNPPYITGILQSTIAKMIPLLP